VRVHTRRAAVALALVLALGGCGTSDDGISAAARSRLAPLVRQIRRAAESRDRAGAQHALAALQGAVAASEQDGEISSAKAAQILAAAERVQHQLGLLPAPTTTTTTTTTIPKKKGHGKGDKHNGDGGGD
jgi:hypothetical protein